MILQIEAVDTLFFRDGKPFEMGDEVWANGIFPPLPSVFYGAIRTTYFSQYPEKLSLVNTENDPTKKLKIKGVYLLKGTRPHFTMPTEMVEKEFLVQEGMEQKESRAFYENNPIQNEVVFSSNPLFLNPYGEVEGANGFIERGLLNKYLKDEFEATKDYYELNNYISDEYKVGIGRQNATRTTEEGKLYRVKLNHLETIERAGKEIRRNKTYFLVDINLEVLGGDFKPNFLKLGGENKIALCSKYDKAIKIEQPEIGKFFKLYFLSPAIFKKSEDKEHRGEGGWLPDCFVLDQTQKAYIGTWKGVKLKLLRSFVNGSVAVGGFDVKEKQPKPMYKAVPAGTVYHFEILENSYSLDIHQVFGNLDTPLSDEYAEQGFGLSIVGFLNETN
ncbi:type III-B CRISPR module-associated protein Cmr3 [Hugenholtzia roseola]|uniref:type III-B CRISPR module-associated protein Cmr3 n=1 Tax=Hugenholtzia roseola TaxID=1002 RepID=UPI0003FA35A4|nr:type III-B CRISPR module-associated protein Cmr3 [Hugenholtzia roseola]